jgi:hypothetical protein
MPIPAQFKGDHRVILGTGLPTTEVIWRQSHEFFGRPSWPTRHCDDKATERFENKKTDTSLIQPNKTSITASLLQSRQLYTLPSTKTLFCTSSTSGATD